MTAIVYGCNGQDGFYLCQQLIRRGLPVIGLGRQADPDPELKRASGFRYAQLDLRDVASLKTLLEAERPSQIFHVAAVHANASGQSCYEDVFDAMLDVNVNSLHASLEYCRVIDRQTRLLYAASAKCFGSKLPAIIDESTPRKSECLYSITKNAGVDLIVHYRNQHQVKAGSVYLFNHESPRRPAPFFVPKLVRALRGEKQSFFTLSFSCDWGSAEEYCEIMVEALAKAPGEDFVLASGRCLLARDLVAEMFKRQSLRPSGLAMEQGQERGSAPYMVSTEKLQRLVGKVPRRTIESVIEEMLQSGD